jgi:hypothetical protein
MSEEPIINNGIAENVPSTEETTTKPVVQPRRKITMKPKARVIIRRGPRKAAPIKTSPPDYERDALVSQTLEDRATQPWRPVSQLFSTKLQGMRPRWVRKDLLEKRIEEGWQPRLSDSKSRLESPESTIIDGTPLSRYVIKRGMILCDMPEQLARSREAYYRKISDGGLKGTNAELDAGTGGNTYGDISIGKE